MKNQLDALRDMTTVVADTGNVEAIKTYRPYDATTNPSLILKATTLPQYQHLIDKSVSWQGHRLIIRNSKFCTPTTCSVYLLVKK